MQMIIECRSINLQPYNSDAIKIILFITIDWNHFQGENEEMNQESRKIPGIHAFWK